MKILHTALLCLCATTLLAQQPQDDIPLVDLRSVDPSIVIDLRYASARNITHQSIYQAQMPPFVRPEVAQRLSVAQKILRKNGFNLMIWDAYRPKYAQVLLWQASPKNDYVANPDSGAGSLHSWGIAVDATMADRFGQPVQMPTDFDDFTPAAMWKYLGNSDVIRHHLTLLQASMREAGFYGIRSEWWHFTAKDWTQLLPPDQAKRAVQSFSEAIQREQKKL
jgi:D-alanyl-D-alanine dipeptidase